MRQPQSSCSPRHRRWRGEHGLHTVEMALWLPSLIMLFLAGLQAALMYWGGSMALSAAQEGARAAAAENATSDEGRAAAAGYLGDGDVLTGTKITSVRGTTSATVTVSGQTLSLVPFWQPTVTKEATRPIERTTG